MNTFGRFFRTIRDLSTLRGSIFSLTVILFYFYLSIASNVFAIFNTSTDSLESYNDSSEASFLPVGRNQINVFIWEPHGTAVGHISLLAAPLTSNPIYVSAWPGGFNSYADDISDNGEGGLPNHMFTFFTDDEGMANFREEWDRVKPRNGYDSYALSSSVFPSIRNLDPKVSCNCIVMALYLLEAAKPSDPSAFSWPFIKRQTYNNEAMIVSSITTAFLLVLARDTFNQKIPERLGSTLISIYGFFFYALDYNITSDQILTIEKLPPLFNETSTKHLSLFKLKKYESKGWFDTRSPEDYGKAQKIEKTISTKKAKGNFALEEYPLLEKIIKPFRKPKAQCKRCLDDSHSAEGNKPNDDVREEEWDWNYN